MVDVGSGAGALVVWMPPSMADAEIEIRAAGQPWDGRHSAVRRRDLPDGSRWAVLFGSLPDGDYELRVCHAPGVQPACSATVRGAVAQMQWPAPPGNNPT